MLFCGHNLSSIVKTQFEQAAQMHPVLKDFFNNSFAPY